MASRIPTDAYYRAAEKCNGHILDMSKELKISRQSVYTKIRKNPNLRQHIEDIRKNIDSYCKFPSCDNRLELEFVIEKRGVVPIYCEQHRSKEHTRIMRRLRYQESKVK